MPPPAGDSSLTRQFQLRARHQRFVANEEQISKATALRERQTLDGKVVTVVAPKGAKDNKGVPDIRKGVYQFLVTSQTVNERTIRYRAFPCWCKNCVIGNYTECVTGAVWETVDMTPNERIIQIQQQADDAQMEEDDGDDI